MDFHCRVKTANEVASFPTRNSVLHSQAFGASLGAFAFGISLIVFAFGISLIVTSPVPLAVRVMRWGDPSAIMRQNIYLLCFVAYCREFAVLSESA